jgi:hypothetical protein
VAQQPHILLLGDSIFDNAASTGGAPDVSTHLLRLLPSRWTATLRAEDGATTDALPRQLARIPPDATYLVISIGGGLKIARAIAAVVGAADDRGTPARVWARC